MNRHMKLVPLFSPAFPLFSTAFTLTMCVYKYLLKILDVRTGQCCKCLLNTPCLNRKHSSSGIQHIPRFCYLINKNKHFFLCQRQIVTSDFLFLFQQRQLAKLSTCLTSQKLNSFYLVNATVTKSLHVVREEDLSFFILKNVLLFNSGILPLVNRMLKLKCTKLVWVEIPCSLALAYIAQCH